MLHPRKAAYGATALALSCMLMLPAPAFAATYVKVGDSEHTSAASGEGWSWDGADDMTLNNYVGGAIVAEGDLVLTLIGENIVANTGSDPNNDAGIYVQAGNLNGDGASSDTGSLVIVGNEGNLSVKGDRVGVYADDGLTIKDADVLVYAEGVGIGTDGVLEINGSTVGAMAESEDAEASVVGAYSYGLSIKDSSVDIIAKVTSEGSATEGAYTAGIDVLAAPSASADINIVNSTVEVSAISSRGNDVVVGIANQANGGGIYTDNSELSVYAAGSDQALGIVGIHASDGDMGFYDSSVSVSSTGNGARGINAQVMEDANSAGSPEITFANSTVKVEAEAAAVASIYYGFDNEETSLANKGRIILENSAITLGGKVLNILLEIGEDEGSAWFAGQTIGTGEDIFGDENDAELASEVVIEPIESNEGAVSEGSAEAEGQSSASANVIAQAGDNTAVTGVAAGVATVAALLAGFAAFARRKVSGC